jgi:predicted nucleic acid-binding protein
VPIAGIAGVLLAAKKQGFVDEILPILKRLEEAGYRLSEALIKEIGKLAGESE